MALENLVDGMTGLQMANAIKNNFDKVLDAESAENKAENAGLSIKTDYDATRYIDLQLADGTPVKMKMDVFCQAIAPVVAGQMLLNKLKVYKKTTTAGGSGLFSGLSFVKSFFTYVVQDSDNRKFILSHTYFVENSEAPVHTIIINNGLEFGQSNIYGTQGIAGLTDTASVYIFVFI